MATFDRLILTTTYATVTAADSIVLPGNSQRRYLAIFNRDTGFVDLGIGTAAVAGQGLPLVAAVSAGAQGGGFLWECASGVDPRAIHAIAPAGSHLTIIEGV